MNKQILTHESLKSQLSYNSKTGVFTKTLKTSGISKIAGNKDCRGYIYIRLNLKKYSAHRLAWFYVHGYMPNNLIDHINGIKSDNRILNLREATPHQNVCNSRISKKNTSGNKGVYLNKLTNKWVAQSMINGSYVYLGTFCNKEDAVMSYENFASKNHGEFYYKQGCLTNN